MSRFTISKSFLLMISVVAGTTSRAGGQERPAVPRPAPRTAGIAPAPPAAASGAQPASVGAGFVPVVVGNDGRVFANFGAGYEQILRSCAGPSVAAATSASASAAPSYLPQPFSPPVYTPPVYVPPTYTPPVAPQPSRPHGTTASSTAGIASPPAPTVAISERARSACWTTNELGKIVVIR